MLDRLVEKHLTLGKAFEVLRQKLKIPDKFLMVEGDNELLIDTLDTLSLALFLDMIKKRGSTLIKEFLFDKNSHISVDQYGKAYSNEIIAIIHNFAFEPVRPLRNMSKTRLKRSFPPGSEWVYAKIYCGEKSADRILEHAVGPFVESLYQRSYFEQWFFIRYADPETHLRVRFKLADRKFAGELQTALLDFLDPWVISGLIHDIKLDTYHREIHRYGEASMELCESWFYEESRNVIQLISAIEGEEGDELKWQYAVLAIDKILEAFQFDLGQKKSFVELYI